MSENNYSREDSIPTRQKWQPPALNNPLPVNGPDMERFHREGVWAERVSLAAIYRVPARSLAVTYRVPARSLDDIYFAATGCHLGAAPTPQPCQGCINYYGKEHGGNMLVCAIHPSGIDGDTCLDFEGKQKEDKTHE